MDFLEGALLGPLWTDTDYEDRSHRGLRLLLSFLFWLGILAMMFFINFRALSLSFIFDFPLFPLFLVLVFVSPFLSMIYYHMPVIIRLPILGIQAVKHLSFFLSVYKIFLPYLRLDINEVIVGLTNFSDNTIGRFIEFYTERYEAAGMLIGTAFLAIVGILVFIILLLVFIYLPQLLLLLVRQIQMIWDVAVRAFIRLTERRKKVPAQAPQTAMGPQPAQGAIPNQKPTPRRQAFGPRPSKADRSGINRPPVSEPSPQKNQTVEAPSPEQLPPREELFQRHEVRVPRIRPNQEISSDGANHEVASKDSKEEL